MYKYYLHTILISEKVNNQIDFSAGQVSLCDTLKRVKYINPKQYS